MPLYEYLCGSCGHRFERIHQKFSDPPVRECPSCGGPVEKQISSPAIQFKGAGFYITDYAKAGQGDKKPDSKVDSPKEGGPAPAGNTESKADAPAADSKADKATSASTTSTPAPTPTTDKK